MTPLRTASGLLLLTSLFAAAGCLDESITGTRATSIALEADPATAGIGETVTISWVATGTSIAAVILDYGDESADTVTYPAPVEVADLATHVYDSAATFTVQGKVVAVSGTKTDEISVVVN